jgi:hypothetical protein
LTQVNRRTVVRLTAVLLDLTHVMTVLLMLLLLEPKKKRFVPSPDRSALQSTKDSCRVSRQTC